MGQAAATQADEEKLSKVMSSPSLGTIGRKTSFKPTYTTFPSKVNSAFLQAACLQHSSKSPSVGATTIEGYCLSEERLSDD